MVKLFDTYVSIALVCDRYSEGVTQRVFDSAEVLKRHFANYEVLVVDNGLLEQELAALKEILTQVPCIRIIRLAKVVDLDTAVFAGVEAAIGDHICILYNNDPIARIPDFVAKNRSADIVFGIAQNLSRPPFQKVGTSLFYWYNRRFLDIDIPDGSTYYVCVNRGVANAITRNDRNVRYFRHLAKLVGFNSVNLEYQLPPMTGLYVRLANRELIQKAIDVISIYSSHPLRVVSYFGLGASFLNIAYAVYVFIVRLTQSDIAEGWATLSLQNSLMFCLVFVLLAVIAEYLGKILIETRRMPPYHIMQELSSAISLADQTRRNVAK